MDTEEFNNYVEAQINICRATLLDKAAEYATEDRLHNFRVAARLQGIDPAKALAGMMAKHSVSIFDMCNDASSHPLGVWEEKITDHINYLLLLKAIISERPKKEIGGLPLMASQLSVSKEDLGTEVLKRDFPRTVTHPSHVVKVDPNDIWKG